MGLSDAVPGVSGGTMALVLGIYARLVDAVSGVGGAMLRRLRSRSFWSRVREQARRPAEPTNPAEPADPATPSAEDQEAAATPSAEDQEAADASRLLLLASLAVGLVPALVAGAATLPSLLSLYPAQMRGLFLGLVMASVAIPARQIDHWRPALLALASIAALATAWFVGLPERTAGNARGTVVLYFDEPVAQDAHLTPGNVTLVAGAATLPSLLSLYPAQMRGLFLGLVMASVAIPARQIDHWRPALLALASIAALATAWFVGLPERTAGNARGTVVLYFDEPVAQDAHLTPGNVTLVAPQARGVEVAYGPAFSATVPAGSTSIQLEVVARMAGTAGNAASGSIQRVEQSPIPGASVSQPDATRGGRDPSLALVFVAGLLAISAMTLPGVSGAFVLLLLGLYHYVTHALKATLAGGDPESVLVVATMVAAMGTGLLTFARALRWLFDRWREGTLAVLVGLMAGSLRKLWPFVEHGADGREALAWPGVADPALGATVLLFVAGAGAVLALEAVGRRRKQADALSPGLE